MSARPQAPCFPSSLSGPGCADTLPGAAAVRIPGSLIGAPPDMSDSDTPVNTAASWARMARIGGVRRIGRED